MSLRPFFPYYGSKWNIARYYPRPQQDIVVEPFAGGAGYSTFYGCPRVHLIDADPIIVGVWRYLTRVSPQEILGLPEIPEVGDGVDNYVLPPEAKWLIGFWLNRGSAQPKKTRTAYSTRTDKAQLNWGGAAKRRLAQQVTFIRGWSVQEGDFTGALDIDATWFIDPPYGEKGKFYRHQFSRFAELGEWANSRSGMVVCCEGPGATWLPFEPLGSFKSSKGRAMEFVHVRGIKGDLLASAV